jgi:hypothetical protein
MTVDQVAAHFCATDQQESNLQTDTTQDPDRIDSKTPTYSDREEAAKCARAR